MNNFIKHFLIVSFFFFASLLSLSAQNKYWRSNSGNWNDNTKWSSTQAFFTPTTAPTSIDNAIFDASSFTILGATVTLNISAACNNMDWTGVANGPTFAMSNPLTINGTNLTFVPAMSIGLSPGSITFKNLLGTTFETGSTTKTFGDLDFLATGATTVIKINNTSGGSHNFGKMSVGTNATLSINCIATFNGDVAFSSQTITNFQKDATFKGALFFGVSTTSTFTGNFIFNKDVTVSGTIGAGVNWGNCTFNGPSNNSLTGLTQLGTTVFNSGTNTEFKVNSATLGNTSLNPGAKLVLNNDNVVNTISKLTLSGGSTTIFNGQGQTNITTFNPIGNCSSYPVLDAYNNYSANVNFGTFPLNQRNNLTINHIYNTGPAITILSGTGGGNSMININDGSSASPRTLYWVDNNTTGNWSDCLNWSTIDGTNIGGVPIPGPNDKVFFNGNSFSVAGRTVNLDISGSCYNIDWTGTSASKAPFFSISNPLTVNGNILTFSNTMGINSAPVAKPITFTNTGNVTVEFGTSPPSRILGDLNFTGVGSNIKINNTSSGAHTFGAITVADNSTFNIKSSGSNTYNGVINMGKFTNSTFTDAPLFKDNVTFSDNAITSISGTSAINKNITFGNNTYSTLNGGTVSGKVKFGTNTQATWNSNYTFNDTFDCDGTANLIGLNFTGSSSFNGLVTVNSASNAGFNIVNAIFYIGTNTITGLFKSTGSISLYTNTGIIKFLGNYDNSFNILNIATSSSATFSNNSNKNTFNTINLSLGGYINFNSGALASSKITTFNTSGICGVPAYINSDNGSQANVDFGTFPNKNNIQINNINYTGTPSPITINALGSNINNTNILISVPSLTPRTLYWIGGTGNWNDCSHWTTIQGVNVGGSPVPTGIDDVNFDNTSFTATSQIVTLDVSSAAICEDMIWANSIPSGTTFSMANFGLVVNGNLTLANTLLTITGGIRDITFNSIGNFNVELGSGAKQFRNFTFSNAPSPRTINFDVTNGGNHTFTGNFTVANSTISSITTLNINSSALVGAIGNRYQSGFTIGNYTNLTTNTATAVTDQYFKANYGDNTNVTFNGGPSTFSNTVDFGKNTVSTSNAGATFNNNVTFDTGTEANWTKTYTFTGTGAVTVKGTAAGKAFNIFNPIFNVTTTHSFSGLFTSSGTVELRLGILKFTSGAGFNNTYNNMSLSPGTTVTFNSSATSSSVFSGNFLPTGTCANPVTINSDVVGTKAKVNFGTFPGDNRANLVIRDINYIGTLPPLVINDGTTAGTNTNITINDGSSLTPRKLFWVKNSGNWSGCTNWSTVSGGNIIVKEPTQYDDVEFNDLSFSGSGFNVTINASTNVCNNITWQNNAISGNNIIFSSGSILNVFGSMTLSNKIGSITDAGNGYINFKATTGKTITTAAEILPQVEFTGVNGTWGMQDAMIVSRQFGVISGTVNTNDNSITCNDFNAYQGSDLARTINLGNTLLTLTGNNNSGPADIFDLQGNNITWSIGSSSKILANNTNNGYLEFYTGAKAKTIPDIQYNGPNDIDVHTGSSNNLITFRSITVSTTNAQFYIDGNCPKVYGNLLFADNLNTGAASQRRIQGSNSTSNVFGGTVTFGNNCGFTFENNNIFSKDVTAGNNCTIQFSGNTGNTGDGNNVFGQNFTMGTNSRLNFSGTNNETDTFNGNVLITSTTDADNAINFGVKNVFNANVDITTTNIGFPFLRTNPTVNFNNLTGTTSINGASMNLHGTNGIYRFSGAASQAAGNSLTFDNSTSSLFVGGNASNSSGQPTPGPGAYNLLGKLILNNASTVEFSNTSNNTFNNITQDIFSIFNFTSSIDPNSLVKPLTNVNGTHTTNGNCNNYITVGSNNFGQLANVTYLNNAQTWNGAIVIDINVISGSKIVTVNGGSNRNSQTPGVTIIFNSSGNPLMYWVGGNPNNTSTDNRWTNPKNWALNLNPSSLANGNGCYPDPTTTVIFYKGSFSTSGGSNPKSVPQKTSVWVDDANYVKNCKDMIWMDDVNFGTVGASIKPRIYNSNPNYDELDVYGNLRFADNTTMQNDFNGLFRFVGSGSYIIDANGGSNLPSAGNGPAISSNVTKFLGPIAFDNRSSAWSLNSDIVVNSDNRGNIDLYYGQFYVIDSLGGSRNITLDGNWTVQYPGNNYSPDQALFYQGVGTVTFNGKNSNTSTQYITSGREVISGGSYFNDFYNVVINRQSAGTTKPGASTFGNSGDVVIKNRYSIYNGNPGNYSGAQSYNSGITVFNNFTITSGNFWDNGYQIVGNNTGGKLNIANTGAMHLGSPGANQVPNNDNPQTSVFPTKYKRANIVLDNNSIVSYRANGNQDISTEPVYSNLYLANPNQCITFSNGLEVLNAPCTKKRLVMPNTSPRSSISTLDVLDNLTIESGLLLADDGFQITGITNRSTLNMQKGAALFIGSGTQTVAASVGDGTSYNPASNINGTYTTAPISTIFPYNFDDAKITLDPQSIVVYHSSLTSGQNVRGLSSPTQYGHLVIATPTGNNFVPKTLLGPTTIKGNLIIEPNSNFIDDGNQITGTTGQLFTMNYNVGFSLNGIFVNQTPKGSGTLNGASNPTPLTVPTTNNPFNPSQTNTFGVVFNGYINIPTSGSYTFYTASDDGSNLYIDGNQIVNNDYYQGITQRQGTVVLTAGLHSINVSFFQGYGLFGLNVRWQGPSTAYADIPASALLSQNKTPNSIDYVYYDGLSLSGSNQTNLNASGIPKTLSDLSQQSSASTLTLSGLSQIVIGKSNLSTTFPTFYGVSDINFDLGTSVVYNGGVNNQQVFGIINGTGNQKYASLTLTNPASPTKTLSKPITTSTGNMFVRESLTINPNNNLIDNGTQIVGTSGQIFKMKNTTLANDPLTNTGSIGTSGESRLTLGISTFGTSFPTNYSLTNGADINFELNTSVVYNAGSGLSQNVAGIQGLNNGSYADLIMTSPSNTSSLALKTLQTNAITIRGKFIINPNNIFADGGLQVSGTSGQPFNMFSTVLNQPKDLVTNLPIGTTGESRYVVGSNGTSTRFPLNYRYGSPSDINFDLGTTVIYNAKSNQLIQGLAGTGSTAYANLTLTNPDALASGMINKYLTSNSVGLISTIRGNLTINPNNNFIDNGIQIAGVAGQKFYMYGATKADDPLSSVLGTKIGTTGTSQLSIGNNLTATAFPTGYVTDVNSASSNTDINFDNLTTVAFCSGTAQSIANVYNGNSNINLLNNYYNLSLIDSTNSIDVKTLVAGVNINGSLGKSLRVRGDLSIGNYNQLDVSSNSYSIFIQGNWAGTLGTPGSQFNSWSGTVTFEGSKNQDVTNNNSGGVIGTSPAAEINQDFHKIIINKSSNDVTLKSLVGIRNDLTFTNPSTGDIVSGPLTAPSFTTSPSILLIFRSGATVNGAKNNSHVTGAVRKIGNQDFTFPLGNGTTYRSDAISNIVSNNSCFISQYFNSSTKSAGFPSNLRQDPPLKRVSGVEFWMLNREVDAGGGNSDANVTLTWNDLPIGGTSGGVGDFTQLRVARWNGSMWRDMGGSINGGSSNSTGSVISTYTTTWPVVGKVDQFSPFTLGSTTVFNPLPVTLVSFDAVVVNGKVDLHWKTSFELNTKNFVVERSPDGKNFLQVASVNAKGNSNANLDYYSVDEKPLNGTSYYRLKIVDFDGTESYSKQIPVRIDGLDIDEISLYPNPYNQYEEPSINITFNTPYSLSQIVDMTGKNVQFKLVEKLDSKLSVQFYDKISAGTYIAVLVREDGKQLKRIKFVVY